MRGFYRLAYFHYSYKSGPWAAVETEAEIRCGICVHAGYLVSFLPVSNLRPSLEVVGD